MQSAKILSGWCNFWYNFVMAFFCIISEYTIFFSQGNVVETWERVKLISNLVLKGATIAAITNKTLHFVKQKFQDLHQLSLQLPQNIITALYDVTFRKPNGINTMKSKVLYCTNKSTTFLTFLKMMAHHLSRKHSSFFYWNTFFSCCENLRSLWIKTLIFIVYHGLRPTITGMAGFR